MKESYLSSEGKRKLISYAFEARKRSYCPYSDFAVGAAVMCDDGTIFQGCNIENASYSATICAERSAILSAVSSGQQNFLAIAIVGGKKDAFVEEFVYPCGVCRQVMVEFCENNFLIIVAKSENDYQEFTLDKMVPYQFDANYLG